MKNIFFLLLCIPPSASAQLTLQGKIVDEFNRPLPFVNVVLQKTTYGTVTNDDGKFYLKTKKYSGILEISFVGFENQTFKVNENTKYLNIVLKERANQLDEVVVVTKPKKRLEKEENPAYNILKELWKRKRKLGLRLVNHYQYKKHAAIEVGLNNLDTVFLKKIFKKSYHKDIKQIQYDSDGINYYIPVFLKEKITKVYGNTIDHQIREDVKAEREEGLGTDGFIFDRMSNTFQNINIFENNIPLLVKSFVSPLSSNGFATYDYVLYDSIVQNNQKLYNIYFFPRRDGDLAFQGNVWIASKNYYVKKIKMAVHKSINLNFVRDLSFEKEFEVKHDSIYLPIKNMYSGDFTLVDKQETNKGLTIKKTSTFSDYILNRPKPPEFYSIKIEKVRPNQFKQDENFWNNAEKIVDKDTYSLINVIKNKKRIKNITGFINTITNGYLNTKSGFQLGPLWTFFAYNQVEGFRTKLGFRTFKSKNDRFRVSGHTAYGFKDGKIKYGLEGRYLLSYQPRIAIGLAYLKDVEQLGSSTLLNTNQLLGNSFGTNALFNRGTNFFLAKVHKIAANFDYQIKRNLHLGVNLSHARIQSASKKDFSMNYRDEKGNMQSQTTDVATSLYLSYTPGRFVYGLGVVRRFGRNIFPTLVLNYQKGYKGLFNGTHTYTKIQIKYNHPILLGKLGLLDATVEGGKTFGTVPLALLNPVPANQSFSLVKNTFTLLNYYDFVTDTYAITHLEHHFNGLILNGIPLIKKLKLRSLVTFRAVYGTISERNRAINRSTIHYSAPNTVYYEYGVGLENIGHGNLRFLRIDAIWRSNYTVSLAPLAMSTPKFAIRIGIKPDL